MKSGKSLAALNLIYLLLASVANSHEIQMFVDSGRVLLLHFSNISYRQKQKSRLY